MNKRQKKKYEKKFHQKSYYNVRKTIITKIMEHIPLDNNHNNDHKLNIVYVVDSRRIDYKHPLKISMLSDCYPSSISYNTMENGGTAFITEE